MGIFFLLNKCLCQYNPKHQSCLIDCVLFNDPLGCIVAYEDITIMGEGLQHFVLFSSATLLTTCMLKKRFYLYLQEKTCCWTVIFARLWTLLKILFHIFIQQGWLISNEIGISNIFRFQKYGIGLSRSVLLLDTYDVDDKMDSEIFLMQTESGLGFKKFSLFSCNSIKHMLNSRSSDM